MNTLLKAKLGQCREGHFQQWHHCFSFGSLPKLKQGVEEKLLQDCLKSQTIASAVRPFNEVVHTK